MSRLGRPKKIGVRANVPTYVYRCYDATDRLLYVGCSNGPLARVETHYDAWWGDQIASVRYTVFPNRDKALSIERGAIWTERPRCNVKGRWRKHDPRTDWTIEDYREYRETVLRTARGYMLGDAGRLIAAIDTEVMERFGVRLLAGRSA